MSLIDWDAIVFDPEILVPKTRRFTRTAAYIPQIPIEQNIMNTKTVYYFNSKHLGQAFMNELVDMGYVDNGNPLEDLHTFIITNFRSEGEKSVGFSNGKPPKNYTRSFQLDSNWDGSLAHAKDVINPPIKFFDWDVDINENSIQIAPGCLNSFIIDKKFAKDMVSTLKAFQRNRMDSPTVKDFIEQAEKILKT